MVTGPASQRLIDACPLGQAALCLLLAIQVGCGSHREIQRPEPRGSGLEDTLAVFPFRWAEGGHQARLAICEALSSQSRSYTVAIQPVAETDERLRNAGWSPESAFWHVALGYIETDSSAYLGRLSGAQFVMIGGVSSYGEASLGSFLGSLLTLGMVPPGSDKEDLQLDVAIYDCRSRERVWTYHDQGFRKVLYSPQSLRQTVGERLASRLPFTRR